MNMSEVCLSFRAEIASVWAVFHTTIDRAARTHDEVLSKTGSSGRALKALLAIQKEASSVWFERMT